MFSLENKRRRLIKDLLDPEEEVRAYLNRLIDELEEEEKVSSEE